MFNSISKLREWPEFIVWVSLRRYGDNWRHGTFTANGKEIGYMNALMGNLMGSAGGRHNSLTG